MLFGKLGKRPRRVDSRTLEFWKYRRVGASPAPSSMGYSGKAEKTYPSNPWPMFLNDSLGDCTIAAAGHMIAEWSADAGRPFMPLDADILKAYEAVSGYTPSDPSTDQGAVMLDVLNYWRNTGIAGHNITAFVSLLRGSSAVGAAGAEVADSVWFFGSCYIGIQLPLSVQGASVWSVPSSGPTGDGEPGSWGGHSVPIIGYSPEGLTVVTWGAKLNMSWNFLQTYCDEAYAVLSKDWIESDGKAYSGFDVTQLLADLGSIK